MLHDEQGFAIYFADDDRYTDCGADDPEYGEPEGWPIWTDEFVWVSSRDVPPVLPGEDDCRWAAEHVALPIVDGPLVESWAEYVRWSERLDAMNEDALWRDQLEQMHYIDGDEACAAAGLSVG
jgi:hypothetical protein